MRIKACLKPGQNGTKKWREIYGDRLVAVRYRYDAKKERRYTTVELIVGEDEWQSESLAKNNSDLVGIRVAGYELDVRDKVKRAGGIWRVRQQLWELPYGKIVALGLEERIIDG
ncbi:MAG: hypothetical protein L3J28_12905 [Candidatus Polarisedimenticolaceae bacterium]|nr:hypothetical protein [Candidatus Polarisedimenticolaceae bacterium]